MSAMRRAAVERALADAPPVSAELAHAMWKLLAEPAARVRQDRRAAEQQSSSPEPQQ